MAGTSRAEANRCPAGTGARTVHRLLWHQGDGWRLDFIAQAPRPERMGTGLPMIRAHLRWAAGDMMPPVSSQRGTRRRISTGLWMLPPHADHYRHGPQKSVTLKKDILSILDYGPGGFPIYLYQMRP